MSDTMTLTIVGEPGAGEKASTRMTTLPSPEQQTIRAQSMRGDMRLMRLRRAVIGGLYRVDPQRIALKLLKRG